MRPLPTPAPHLAKHDTLLAGEQTSLARPRPNVTWRWLPRREVVMHLRLQSRTGPEKLSVAFRFLFPLVRIATSGPAE